MCSEPNRCQRITFSGHIQKFLSGHMLPRRPTLRLPRGKLLTAINALIAGEEPQNRVTGIVVTDVVFRLQAVRYNEKLPAAPLLHHPVVALAAH